MYAIVLATALLGQCQVINGRMVCPLQQQRPVAAPAPPLVVEIRYIQLPPRPQPRPVQQRPRMAPPAVHTFRTWY